MVQIIKGEKVFARFMFNKFGQYVLSFEKYWAIMRDCWGAVLDDTSATHDCGFGTAETGETLSTWVSNVAYWEVVFPVESVREISEALRRHVRHHASAVLQAQSKPKQIAKANAVGDSEEDEDDENEVGK